MRWALELRVAEGRPIMKLQRENIGAQVFPLYSHQSELSESVSYTDPPFMESVEEDPSVSSSDFLDVVLLAETVRIALYASNMPPHIHAQTCTAHRIYINPVENSLDED